MPAGGVGHLAGAREVDAFLDAATVGPSGLLIEGEPGIGKTTLWLAAVERAGQRGFQVLSARAAEAESVLAYTPLTDLLSAVDLDGCDLPDPQRRALDRVLWGAEVTEPATDQRAVAAGFLSVVERLAAEAPVLIAVDDMQWLDPSSIFAVAFIARRLSGRVGVLGTVRTGPDSDAASWLQLPAPDAISHIGVPPLSIGGLQAVLSERLGRSFSRPTLVRIHQISGGNPFYALELARIVGDEGASADVALPPTLAELVTARIDGLGTGVQKALLAAACVAAPTVELVARALGTGADDVAEILADAEDHGIVEIDGHHLHFAHPLLARGVYTATVPAERRAMHRCLANVVEEPELRARHLGLAAVRGDARTLDALDGAAEMAFRRGAPAAAVELLRLAMSLGGDTHGRRIRLASHRFNAGDPGRARGLLESIIDELAPGPLRAEALGLLGYVRLYDDNFGEAADTLDRALGEPEQEPRQRVRTLITRTYALFYGGQLVEGLRSVEEAVAASASLGDPHLLSQALGMQVVLHFMVGDGLDESGLQRALDLEDPHARTPVAFRPTLHNALLSAWTGKLDQAHRQMLTIRQRCIDNGEESELALVAVHSVQLEIWRGNLPEATQVAEQAMERALQLDGDFPLAAALTMRAALASYVGDVDQARRDAAEAHAAATRCGSHRFVQWPLGFLGFLEVSLGDYQAALNTLAPLLRSFDASPNATEIYSASAIPDAAEAFISLGRLDEAETLIERMERNGARLDRAWMLAVGGRCRAMLLAARGDVDAASAAAEKAMVEHDRLPMPFERARTRLLLGQLQRRQRHKGVAAGTLSKALATFEALGTSLWAEKARAELARTTYDLDRATALSATEQRVAELVAVGMSNRDVASSMFLSPKTVEAHLSRIYRKLGIHSRAELARHLRQQQA